MEDNVTEKQSDLVPYCLQYKQHKSIISKLHEHQQTREADGKWLNKGSLEEKKLNYANCITVI